MPSQKVGELLLSGIYTWRRVSGTGVLVVHEREAGVPVRGAHGRRVRDLEREERLETLHHTCIQGQRDVRRLMLYMLHASDS